MDNTVL